MNDLRIDGVSTINGGEYGTIKIDGVCKCKSALKAERISANGVFKCEGPLEAGLLDCDGSVDVKANVKIKELHVDGLLGIHDGTKLEAETIKCNGMISIKGQVSADEIKVDGAISADEIVGDKIFIKTKFFGLKLFGKHSKVGLIEATEIKLQGVKAKQVNGTNIIIRSDCQIESLECNGTLSVHPDAKIGTITGDYTTAE